MSAAATTAPAAYFISFFISLLPNDGASCAFPAALQNDGENDDDALDRPVKIGADEVRQIENVVDEAEDHDADDDQEEDDQLIIFNND